MEPCVLERHSVAAGMKPPKVIGSRLQDQTSMRGHRPHAWLQIKDPASPAMLRVADAHS